MSYYKFEPREDLVTRLRDETREVAGFDIYDVRWDTGKTLPGGQRVPGRDCLCIFEKSRRGTEIVREELRDPPTEPDASKTFEYTQPDGTEVTTHIPIGPDDPSYLKKVIGLPRQITEADVERCVQAAVNRVKMAKAIAEKLQKQQEELKAKAAAVREEYTMETAEQMARILHQFKTGKNAFVDYGHRDEVLPGEMNESGYKVVDRRQVV